MLDVDILVRLFSGDHREENKTATYLQTDVENSANEWGLANTSLDEFNVSAVWGANKNSNISDEDDPKSRGIKKIWCSLGCRVNSTHLGHGATVFSNVDGK